MTTDPRDPAFDDRTYCDACLHLLDDGDLAGMGDDPDEEHECPYCHRGLRAVGHVAMRAIVAERKADEDAAREDGLIR